MTTPYGDISSWSIEEAIPESYEIRDVKHGGMGRVYRVYHHGWDTDLAMKVPHPEFCQSAKHREAFVAECETWIHLGLHPHVVTCYYAQLLKGVPAIFSEYVTGGSLCEWIRKGTLYAGDAAAVLDRILDVAIQIAWGLQHAHDLAVIHQDVKPSNVLMTSKGTAKITDFGLAKAINIQGSDKLIDGSASLYVTCAGMTPAYCSPEQLEATTPQKKSWLFQRSTRLTKATDIWSWAAVVLEMFAGGISWPIGPRAGEALQRYVACGASARCPVKMPKSAAKLLSQCFERSPRRRPKSFGSVVSELQGIYEKETGQKYGRRTPEHLQGSADTLNNRAVSFLDLGKPSEAVRLFEDALRSRPNHATAAYNLGLLRWRLAHGTDADLLAQLRQAAEADSESKIAHYLSALVHLEQADGHGALECLRLAESDEENRPVQTAICRANSILASSPRQVSTLPSANVVCFAGTDGHVLTSQGRNDYSLQLWDIPSGRELRTLPGHTGAIKDVCATVDGRLALTASSDGTLRLWDLGKGQSLHVLRGHSKAVQAASLTSDGHHALSTSLDGTTRLWDLRSGQTLKTMSGCPALGSLLPNRGQTLVVVGEAFYLIDLETGRRLVSYLGHTEHVSFARPGAGDRTVLSGGLGCELFLWDLVTGEKLQSFRGHRGDEVICGDISHDGRWVLSGGDDYTTRLWDAKTGQCFRTFEEPGVEVGTVRFSNDDRLAIWRSGGNTLAVWDISRLSQAISVRNRAPYVLCRATSSSQASADFGCFRHFLGAAQKAAKSESFTVMRSSA